VGLEKDLTTQKLAECLERLQPWGWGVTVYLPKFDMFLQYDLEKALKSLGTETAFQKGKADFTGCVGFGGKIEEARQDAWIKIDEVGTTAVGVSCPEIGGADFDEVPVKEEPKIFRVDHPFFFIIRHNPSNCILFIGKLFDPRAT
jgi:serpin B